MRSPAPRRLPVVLFSVSAAVFSWVLYRLGRDPLGEGDTAALVKMARGAAACWRAGIWMNCRQAGPFPLMQYIPAWIRIAFGAPDGAILKTLAVINEGAFAFMVLGPCVFLLRRRRPAAALLGLLILVTGPFIFYYRSTFGETLAAAVASLFGLALLARLPAWAIAAAGLAVGATKDIAAPLVAVFGLAALGPDLIRDPRRCRAQIFGLAAAVPLSLVPSFAFNYFRFGGVLNRLYLDYPRVPTPFSFFLGLWFAPNGGLWFFWPTFCAWLAVVVVVNGRSFVQSPWRDRIADSLPAALVALGAVILTGMLAFWWDPFGWVSWGPRLVLPWLPLSTLILCAHDGGALKALAATARRRWRLAVALGLALILVSAANLLANFAPQLRQLATEPFPAGCPRLPIIEEDARYYYECMYFRMWQPARFALAEAYATTLAWKSGGWTLDFVVMCLSGGIMITMAPARKLRLCLGRRRKRLPGCSTAGRSY